MANSTAPTAAQLVDFLQRNDPAHSSLPPTWHRHASRWCADELETVRQAIHANTSIKSLAVNCAQLDENQAELIVSLIRNFNHVECFSLCLATPLPGQAGGAEILPAQAFPPNPHLLGHVALDQVLNLAAVPPAEVVPTASADVTDRILYGMSQSRSELLSFRTVLNGGSKAIRRFFSRFAHLQKLCLGEPSSSSFWLTDQFAGALAQAIEEQQQQQSNNNSSSKLEHVELYCRGYPTALVIDALRSVPSLREVELSIHDASTAHVTLEFAARLCCCTTNTSSTSASGDTGENGVKKLSIKCVGVAPHTGSLSVAGFFSLQNRVRTLEALRLENLVLPAVSTLAPVLENSFSQNLVRLDLISCTMTGDTKGERLRVFVDNLPKLQHLDVLKRVSSRNGGGGGGGNNNNNAVNAAAHHITLRSNAALVGLAEAISGQQLKNNNNNNNRSLNNLRVYICPDASNQNLPGIQSLLQVARGSMTMVFLNLPRANTEYIRCGLISMGVLLRRLHLFFSRGDITDADCASLFQALVQNRALEQLKVHLMLNDLFHTGAAVNQLLRQNMTLKSLVFGDVFAENAASFVEPLAIGLAHNTSLRCLDLHQRKSNPSIIPPSAVPLVVEALKHNTSLMRVDGVSFPEGSGDAEVQCKFLLKLNRYGRRYLTCKEAEAPTLGVWSRILGVIATDPSAFDVMFHFLRTKPNLIRGSSGGIKRPQGVNWSDRV